MSKQPQRTPLSTEAPNPFKFNPADAMTQKTVDYISPQKRKYMKEYLSNSSINLSNGAEKHYSSQSHFQSSNQVDHKKFGQAPSYDQLRVARDQNNANQRKQNVWMGQENAFKTYKRQEQATVSKSVLNDNSSAGASLRKHNFKFGFEDRERMLKDKADSSAAAKKSLYEFTKSSEHNGAWRKDQMNRHRASHIQWGLNAEVAPLQNDRSYGAVSGKNHMNHTFTNFNNAKSQGSTIESTRTAKNKPSNLITGKNRSRYSIGAAEPISQKDLMLNKGGKRIDVHHSQKQTVVGNHIVNPNAQEPVNFEKGTVGRDNLQPTAKANRGTNVMLSYHKRAQSDMMNKSNGLQDRSRSNLNYSEAKAQARSKLINRTVREEQGPAAGSANLMSPQQRDRFTYQAAKRIGQDMKKNNIRFEAANNMTRKSVDSSSARLSNDLRMSYHNRNKDHSRVMGQELPENEAHHLGLYKTQMNMGTSKVNWNDVTDNKNKISEYHNRMLNQKQELGLGHTGEKKAHSVKAHSYVPHGHKVDDNYIGNTANSKDYKAIDQKVTVNLQLNQLKSQIVSQQGSTEARTNYKRYTGGKDDHSDMINKLKASNVALGTDKFKRDPNSHIGRDKVNQEIGQNTNMYSYVKQRGYNSNVLPLNANADTMKPLHAHINQENTSMTKSSFKWNNFQVR